jgi:hypothetical protein
LTRVDLAWFHRLKLQHDESLSNAAFNINLSHYTAVEAVLKDLGVTDIPRITVWNKVDAVEGPPPPPGWGNAA